MHELVFMLQFRMVLLLFANTLTFLLHLFNYVFIGIVHHVYSTYWNARTLFILHTIMFCVCT